MLTSVLMVRSYFLLFASVFRTKVDAMPIQSIPFYDRNAPQTVRQGIGDNHLQVSFGWGGESQFKNRRIGFFS